MVVWQLLAGFIAACLCAPIPAQTASSIVTKYDFQSVRTETPRVVFPLRLETTEPPATAPLIDGMPNDDCWQPAPSIHLWSDSGSKKATRSTRVRICYDADNLYVIFECTEPDLVAYWPLENPEAQWAEFVGFFFAPHNPSAPEVRITINPRDLARTWNAKEGHAWKPKWEMKTALLPRGWCAEMAIPFSSLGVKTPAANELWRANFYRGSVLSGQQGAWQSTFGNRTYTPLWGRVFFGADADYADYKAPVIMHAWPDRYAIRPGEKSLHLLVRVEHKKAGLAQTNLRLLTSRKEETADAFASLTPEFNVPMQGERAVLTLSAEALPTGTFHAYADLLDAEGRILARARVALTKSPDQPAPPVNSRMKLLVTPTGIKSETGKNWPILTGVALPRGELFNPARARILHPSGAEVFAQAHPRSLWPDGSIRWLSLDFCADVTGDERREFILEYGPTVTRKPFKGFVREEAHLPLHMVENNWMVNTNRILFTVNTEQFIGLQSVWVDVDGNGHFDWQEYILDKERGGKGPYIKDVNGNTYAFERNSDLKITLAEWNELRLEVRAEGDLVLVERGQGAAGTQKKEEEKAPPPRLGRCIVRITAYAGQPFVRIRYTFLFTRLAADTVLSDIGVEERFEYDFGKRVQSLFGAPGSELSDLRRTRDVFMIRPAPGQYAIRSKKGRPPIALSGDQAENWICGHAENRGMAIGLRDMEELFPKSFEMIADGALLRIHFWPPQQDELVRELRSQEKKRALGELPFVHYYHLLDLRVPASFGGPTGEEQKMAPQVQPYHYRSDPTGIALTYDTLYYFYRGKCDRDEISAVCKTFEFSPSAVQDQASLAASGVFGQALSPPQAQTALAGAKRLLQLESRAPEQGDLNFLDLHRKWDTTQARWDTNYPWLGTEANLPVALWRLYAQTGDREIFRAAQRNLRHVLGVDFCHLSSPEQETRDDPRHRKIAGAFNLNRTPIHWQETVHISDRHARLRAPLLAWYLTGDSVAYEAALLWRDAAVTHGAPTSGQDGAVFIDNLWVMLQLQYNPLLHEQLGACVEFFSQRPCETAQIDSWGIGLREYVRESGDQSVWRPLKSLAENDEQVEACSARFGLLGLLRDLDHATGKSHFQDTDEAPPAVAAFEQRVKDALTPALPDDGKLNWLDFCAYVFTAGTPAPAPKPPVE